MSQLYSGRKEREYFARNKILPQLRKIEKEIAHDGKNRNLKTEYFKRLIERKDDGFLIIECMAHLRKNFGELGSKDRVLSMILDEWKKQTDVPDSYDTFGGVLRSLNLAPIYTCNALIMQARRIRGTSGVRPKNAEAARKLVKEAEDIWETNYEKRGLELNEKNFCLVPNRLYKNVIETQKVFSDARFADMQRLWNNANDMITKIDDEASWEGDHGPDQILKWWMFQVMLRASAVCMEPEYWKAARDGMESMEALFEGPVLSYLHDIKGRSQGFSTASLANQYVANNDLSIMRDLLNNWNKFRQVEDEVLSFRRRGGSSYPGDKKLKEVQGNFTHSLKDFNKYLMMGAKSGFVSHAYARDEVQSKSRARKILMEISEGRHYVRRSNTNHSCFQLEILHRLLIYRIWWESKGKGFDLFSSEEGATADVDLSLEVPAKILEDIEFDLKEKHIEKSKSERWRKEIRKSIEVFRDGSENLADKLRTRIEGFDRSSRKMQWPEGQFLIMGLPYIPDGENGPESRKSPYDVMDPTMRHVGVNAAGAVPVEGEFLEQRTESQ
tara:strand:+ start:3373 stop:5037 length:1665 start_codon:yes stop_codon:yes gene_type:complete